MVFLFENILIILYFVTAFLSKPFRLSSQILEEGDLYVENASR